MKGYFFDAQLTGADPDSGEPAYDREYSASDHAEYYRSIFTTGVFLKLDPRACEVRLEGAGAGARICVAPGRAFINGYMGVADGSDGWDAISLEDGRYRAVVRLDLSEEVRAIECELVFGSAFAFPQLVRAGNVYDLCLANVTVSGGVPSIADTRFDDALCGAVAFAGMPPEPPYYPPGDLPLELWLYTLFPNVLTPAQTALVEQNGGLMAVYGQSRINQMRREVDQVHESIFSALESNAAIRYEEYTGDGTGFRSREFRTAGLPLGVIISSEVSPPNSSSLATLFRGSTRIDTSDSSVTWGADSVVLVTGPGSSAHQDMNTLGLLYHAVVFYQPMPYANPTTITVRDNWGRPLANVMVNGLTSRGGLPVVTNAQGVAAGVLSPSGTISMSGYADKLTEDIDISASRGGSAAVTYATVPDGMVLRVPFSQHFAFTDNVASVDACAISGGGPGGSGTTQSANQTQTAYAGGGGAGGLTNAYNIPVPAFTPVPVIIAGPGGVTSLLGVTAQPGAAGENAASAESPVSARNATGNGGASGSPGMGDGGGGVANEFAFGLSRLNTADTNPFGDINFPEKFGGGGAGGSNERRSGGNPNGADGSYVTTSSPGVSAATAKGPGGGGGGGGATRTSTGSGRSADPSLGGPGIAFIRINLKEVA